jgi:D-glycero-D-manno-heptose 1,7-bisphosphate phosphatase
VQRKLPCVFLDRDGVLIRATLRNGRPHPPENLEQVELDPSAQEACELLRSAGYLLIVVTNQPDVARGTQTRPVVEAIHQYLRERLPIDDFAVCYHDDANGCDCRKPKPGLILRAAERYGIDLRASVMVGDRWRDVEAGQAAGCRTVWLDYGYAERGPARIPDFVAGTLAEAAEWILALELPAASDAKQSLGRHRLAVSLESGD